MINATAKFIRDKVKQEVKSARFFSISMDETFDASRKEQVTLIVRYIDDTKGEVVERVVSLRESAATTGAALFKVLISIFDELELDWRNYLVAQSYDGASNMRGAYKGLQNLVQDEAPSATYIWCWAHRLNLAVKDVVDCCEDASILFSNLRTLYNFINGSKNNVDLFRDTFKKIYPGKQQMSLKRVDTTRWMSHGDALDTVLKSFDAIVETLDEIKSAPPVSQGDRTHAAEASGLLTYLLSERFLIVAHTFSEIFKSVGPLTAALQGVDIDLIGATNHVNEVLSKLSKMRSDEGFREILEKKDGFISNSAETFVPLPTPRKRRVRRRDGEKAEDTPIDDPLLKLKVSMYFFCIDTIHSLIADRFSETSQGIFRDLALFSVKRILEIKNSPNKGPLSLPTDAFSTLCSTYNKHLNLENLRKEYLQFVELFESYNSAAKSLPETLHPEKKNGEGNEIENDDDWMDIDEGEHVPVSVADADEHTQYEFDDLFNNDDGRSSSSSEISASAAETKNSGSIKDIFKIFYLTGLKEVFPTLETALRIALTLPVSSASAERSFSKLKLVKVKTRCTTGQERLQSLVIIACEKDIEVDVQAVVEIMKASSTYLAKNV